MRLAHLRVRGCGAGPCSGAARGLWGGERARGTNRRVGQTETLPTARCDPRPARFRTRAWLTLSRRRFTPISQAFYTHLARNARGRGARGGRLGGDCAADSWTVDIQAKRLVLRAQSHPAALASAARVLVADYWTTRFAVAARGRRADRHALPFGAIQHRRLGGQAPGSLAQVLGFWLDLRLRTVTVCPTRRQRPQHIVPGRQGVETQAGGPDGPGAGGGGNALQESLLGAVAALPRCVLRLGPRALRGLLG